MEGKHYVLVHGVCHGAWCWYKLKPRLQSSGNKVTVLDLAASGINPKRIEDIRSFSEYSGPLLELLESLPPSEKVVLVGHSFGGLSLALAMDRFPHKIELAVFLTAFVPDTKHPPSYVIEQQDRAELNEVYNMEISSSGSASMIFGSKCLSTKLYQLCPIEDLELAKMLIRPGYLFVEELQKAKNFSEEGYGSVPKAYIVCGEDAIIPLEYQSWMIENAGIDHVLEIKDSDHMAMLSRPQEVCQSLIQIAQKNI
ncbi:polyneuridine-aldehyde esterase-like [Neltuma alba]|uniref:polyneuridine-aldehyde esterase-like n=1 Tax=Neltuma alba TaxID=207710 RepID=UPI0010A446CB|nr:polyneuridine-aldehyde esterase-like [Prosopis alba]